MDSVEIVLVIWLSLRISLRLRKSLMILKQSRTISQRRLASHSGTPIALRRNCQQDAQKGRSARPQRAKRRGVRFGTLSF
jgi:hypothetical protein